MVFLTNSKMLCCIVLEKFSREKNRLDIRQILMSDSGWLKQQQKNPIKK